MFKLPLQNIPIAKLPSVIVELYASQSDPEINPFLEDYLFGRQLTNLERAVAIAVHSPPLEAVQLDLLEETEA